MSSTDGGYAQPLTPAAKGTPGRVTIPTNHYLMESSMKATFFTPQEELVKVKGSFREHLSTALVDFLRH